MGIMDMFRGNAAPGGGQPASKAPPGANPASANPVSKPGDAAVPLNTPSPEGGSSVAASSPLDPFKDLWNNEPAKGADGKAAGKKPLMPIDPKKVSEAAARMSYSGLVPPELATKALGGDVKSFNDILDAVGRASFTHAFTAGNQMMERMADALEGRFRETLPAEVRKHSVIDSQISNNPKLNNPAIRPLFEAIQTQILGKFPDATQAEVQQMASTYLTEVFKTVGGETKQTPEELAAAASKDENSHDWGEYFGLPPKQAA